MLHHNLCIFFSTGFDAGIIYNQIIILDDIKNLERRSLATEGGNGVMVGRVSAGRELIARNTQLTHGSGGLKSTVTEK